MRRVSFALAVFGLAATMATGCAEQVEPINQVGVNVVQKEIFEGSWYVSRTVVDVDYEAAGAGTFPGDAAYDNAANTFGFSIPRVRWVIDEDFIYAYRDYELIEGADGEEREPGAELGHPVAAFAVESHFDIERAYNPVTGEQRNTVIEDTQDRRWYERDFMRVDWSRNMLPGYYGQTFQLYEILGLWERESTDLFVQGVSDFPESWRPQFDFMGCDGRDDTSESCSDVDRDFASDYEKDELYHMAFVGQELLSPGIVPNPFTGAPVNYCVSPYSGTPSCATVAIFVRTSFLKVSESRQYERVNWNDTRFERAGYFRLENQTYDRSLAADDPGYGYTDFKNYSILRHNIWQQWSDEAGNAIPYADRDVRQTVWYTTPELPGHLVEPSFRLVGEWNLAFMSTIRGLRGEEEAVYPRMECQNADPDGYCFCTTDPDTGDSLLPDTNGNGTGDCVGRYDAFETPEDAAARGVVNPYQCHVEVPEGAEPDMNDPGLTDADFNGWFEARMVGDECANVMRINTCNRASIAANDGTSEGLACQERGDLRYKFVSYVDQPGTSFLGIATLRGDPVTGEVVTGDANIGGPALDSYRTFALQQYDVLNGNLTESELLTGENVRSYLENLNNIEQPAPPRIDFSVAARLNNPAAQPELQRMQQHMDSIMARTEHLRGNDARRNIYSDRLQALAGSPLERRLLDNDETFSMLGLDKLPQDAAVTEHVLDAVSPFRGNGAHQMMDEFMQTERQISGSNVMMPNEYVDDSVVAFVEAHKDWPRARLEFALNRLLYFETQLHEMGHCMGLRHSFAASADHENYYDDYYYIDEAFPLPDPDFYDADGTPGLSATEQVQFEDAYNTALSQRERAGIDQWMNTSVMEYTSNWYERTVNRAGRYDFHAINMGYGDLTEAYRNDAALSPGDINPVNTPRVTMKYFHGGESCETDSDCPFAADGSRAGELMSTNLEAGATQHCVANPRGADLGNVCTSFDGEMTAIGSGTARPAFSPVEYEYCTDERASGGGTSPSTLGICNRFDEGDSYRAIVRNVGDSWDRQYLWQNFRRYRSGFNIGSYIFDRMIGRHFVILQNIYQNLAFNYSSDPEFRNETGPFGFQDQFLATTDIVNLYAKVLARPDVGAYRWNEGWQRYQRNSYDPELPGAQLSVPLGMGRYSQSVYQSGITGITRLDRIGTFYDKWFVLQLLSTRGYQTTYTRDVPFFLNFYDLFPLEMNALFGGFIRNQPETYSPRLECEGTFPRCDNPRMVFMDFYRGDCFSGDSDTCRPDPVDVTYRDMPVLDSGANFLIQSYAAIYGLAQFPTYFDTTFQNQLFVCIEGNGACYAPEDGAVEGTDYVRYTSRRYGKSFLAFQVEPGPVITTQTSIGFEMVSEAADLDFIVLMLQKYRGDYGGTPEDINNLTAAEQARLAGMDYDIPTDSARLDNEEDRLFGRLQDLESFFNLLIQLEGDYGIYGLL